MNNSSQKIIRLWDLPNEEKDLSLYGRKFSCNPISFPLSVKNLLSQIRSCANQQWNFFELPLLMGRDFYISLLDIYLGDAEKKNLDGVTVRVNFLLEPGQKITIPKAQSFQLIREITHSIPWSIRDVKMGLTTKSSTLEETDYLLAYIENPPMKFSFDTPIPNQNLSIHIEAYDSLQAMQKFVAFGIEFIALTTKGKTKFLTKDK